MNFDLSTWWRATDNQMTVCLKMTLGINQDVIKMVYVTTLYRLQTIRKKQQKIFYKGATLTVHDRSSPCQNVSHLCNSCVKNLS